MISECADMFVMSELFGQKLGGLLGHSLSLIFSLRRSLALSLDWLLAITSGSNLEFGR